MTKEDGKRTYHAETIIPASLRLELGLPQQKELADEDHPKELQKQFFSNDLLSRLAERIKKL
ncbi:MAG TPA: hypothetical protein DEH25_09520 [Chloroflexi bacterium]|nr:hypothetical protein [Chloroflexota bacterium]